MFEDKVSQMIQQEKMFPEGTRVLIAVSGGADSVCLFHFLRLWARPAGVQLHVVHLHHMLRDSADADETFVRQMCQEHGVPLTVGRTDVGAAARLEGCSVEEAGRNARMLFFRETAQREQCSRVALGHHTDDQAETIIQNLLRGAGSNGLGGMRPVRDIWCRPLLGVSRNEIIAWLQKQGYTWREDETNQEEQFNRNRIRHRLIPLMQEFNPQISRHLAELGIILKAEHDYLENQMKRFAIGHLEQWGLYCIRSFLSPLEDCPAAIRLRLWMECYRLLTGRGLERRYVLQVENSFNAERNDVGLPGGIKAGFRKDRMIWYSDGDQPERYQVLLREPGIVQAGCGMELDIRRVPGRKWAELSDDSGRQVFVDEEKVPWPLVIRSPEPGDGYVPFGSKHHKSLREMFSDRGFPGDIRRAMPVFIDGQGRTFWAGGLRIANDVQVSEVTQSVLRILVRLN